MAFPMQIEAISISLFVLAFVISIIAAISWVKRWWLQLVPFICSAAMEGVLASIQGRHWQWDLPLFMGVMLYVLGWLTIWQMHVENVEKKKRHGAKPRGRK